MPLSDYLEAILLALHERVMCVIPDSTYLQHLCHLLDFLAAWENPPRLFTLMGYFWSSIISKKLKELDQGKNALESRLSLHHSGTHRPQDETADKYAILLLMTLEVGFRRPDSQRVPCLVHKPHHTWIFDVVFSSYDDEAIADAVYVWAADRHRTTTGSCALHLSRRVDRGTPFSPRLRRVIVDVLNQIPGAAGRGVEAARLLNQLDPNVEDMKDGHMWWRLLVDMIRWESSPTGWETLSLRNWRLLGELTLAQGPYVYQLCGPDMEVLRLLHDSENWGRLEVWMVVIWASYDLGYDSDFEVPIEDIKRATFRLLQQQPPALPKFEYLCRQGWRIQVDRLQRRCGLHGRTQVDQLQKICDQVRTEQLSSASL